MNTYSTATHSPMIGKSGPRLVGILTILNLVASCLPSPTAARLKDAGNSHTIFLALNQPVAGTTDEFNLLFATAKAHATLGYCTFGPSSKCIPNAIAYMPATMIFDDGTTKFFSLPNVTPLSDGMPMTIVAGDSSGSVTESRDITFNMTPVAANTAGSSTAGNTSGTGSPTSSSIQASGT